MKDRSLLILFIGVSLITFTIVYVTLVFQKRMDGNEALSIAIPSGFGAGLGVGLLTYFLPQ